MEFAGAGAMVSMLWSLPPDPRDAEVGLRFISAAPIAADMYRAIEDRYGCRVVTMYGMTLTSTSTTTLVERDGDSLSLKTTTVQTADPGPVDWPGIPAGWTSTLTSLDGTATLRQTVDLIKRE